MPVYDYLCNDCGTFDTVAPVTAASHHSSCPDCGKRSKRIISAPFLTSSRNLIRASERNEIAQHEPKLLSQLESKSKHKPGCSCCSGGSGKISRKTKTNAAGDKMFPTSRPWMISH